MYSDRLVEWHFWLALSGTLVYVISMWNSGIVQGLMWRTYSAQGTLAYSFLESLEAVKPYYVARGVGGLLFLAGALVGGFNMWMTISGTARVVVVNQREAPHELQPLPPIVAAE